MNRKNLLLMIVTTTLLLIVTLIIQFDPTQYEKYFAERNSEEMTLYGSVDMEIESDGCMKIVGVIHTLSTCRLMMEII